jgi:hypothetical protein
MNDWLDDHSMGVDLMTDGSHDHHMNDPLDDLTMDVSRDRHMNDPLDDLTMDVSRVNRNYVRRDLSLDAMTDGSHDHRRSDLLGDHSMDGNHVSRNYVLPDRKMDGNLGGNLCLRMSDRLGDHSMDDDHRDVLVDHHMNGMGDRKTDGNHVNRNYAPRDPKMDVNLDAMSHRVMLMVCLSKSCDRMSRDHLRCDHLMMRRHDMNRMDGKNLDGNHPKKDDPTHLRRVNRRMKVCPKMDDRKMILVMRSASYYRHDCLDVSLNY